MVSLVSLNTFNLFMYCSTRLGVLFVYVCNKLNVFEEQDL